MKVLNILSCFHHLLSIDEKIWFIAEVFEALFPRTVQIRWICFILWSLMVKLKTCCKLKAFRVSFSFLKIHDETTVSIISHYPAMHKDFLRLNCKNSHALHLKKMVFQNSHKNTLLLPQKLLLLSTKSPLSPHSRLNLHEKPFSP